ncbi:urea ABC transporter permease subunit UrtC [Lyngbya confervoides]|uniref:Urea ABC transporter permease subunit UrtC n=1 Tax=Lyngbya confervoides BDU141951 TaxID=1574623 RepID=A0ABD4T6W2_9CYAN|nr:urea ABC transporter permease subunit UrtC [Lyngbya confervoides]MCM1984501.1 urea ABC transporter permease subunit UrtC [Lyngbya confervoides BDU141951]
MIFRLISARSMVRRRQVWIEVGLVIAVALLIWFGLPQVLTAVGQGSRVNQLGRFLSLAIVALGIDLIWGYTGMLSLGHGIFFALGGYVVAMHLLQQPQTLGDAPRVPEFFSLYGVEDLPRFWEPFQSFPFAMVAIAAIPAIIAAVLGYLVFRSRIKGVYFSILTQASLIVFFNFFNGQQKLINGTNGLTTSTTYWLGEQVGSTEVQQFFLGLTVVVLAIAYGLCRWLVQGRLGKLLIAIRDDESRLRFSGYNPTGFKVLVFAISAALAGIAGALYTVQSGSVTPKFMDVPFSIEMVIWVAVGGRGTLVGAVLGAILVNFAKTLLSEQFPEIWLFFQGALFLLVVTILSDGIVGWLRVEGQNLWRYLLGKTNLNTYPSLETDPDVTYERETLGNQQSDR